MKPEAQRIAIAGACGWKDVEIYDGPFLRARGSIFGKHPVNGVQYTLPDYLNDLNAMHEAEKVLTEEQTQAYTLWLHTIIPAPPLRVFWHRMVCATAAQRAEAFLRTLNLWQPTADASSTERLG